MNTPADVLDTCPECGHYVRTGQSWHPTPAGRTHAVCPTYATTPTTGTGIKLHHRLRSIPARRI